jgi:hypothetical protein
MFLKIAWKNSFVKSANEFSDPTFSRIAEALSELPSIKRYFYQALDPMAKFPTIEQLSLSIAMEFQFLGSLKLHYANIPAFANQVRRNWYYKASFWGIHFQNIDVHVLDSEVLSQEEKSRLILTLGYNEPLFREYFKTYSEPIAKDRITVFFPNEHGSVRLDRKDLRMEVPVNLSNPMEPGFYRVMFDYAIVTGESAEWLHYVFNKGIYECGDFRSPKSPFRAPDGMPLEEMLWKH